MSRDKFPQFDMARVAIGERLKTHHDIESKGFYAPILPYLPIIHNEALITPGTTPLLKTIADFCIDYGTSQKHTFQDQEAPGVALLNRSAFISHLLSVYRTNQDAPPRSLSAKIIDISKFRKADQADDGKGNRGADYNVNLIAAKINEKVMEMNAILREFGIDGYVMPCRYGGDEFGIAIIGVTDEALQSEIYMAILGGGSVTGKGYADGIADIEGYMNVAGKPKLQKIKLKPESLLKEIHVPLEETKQRKFWEQLEHGMLLNDDELQSVVEDETTHGLQPMQQSSENTIIPVFEDRHAFRRYIKDLKKLHPELSGALEVIYEQANRQRKPLAQAIWTEFGEFVHNVVFDRLLGERVTSYTDFLHHVQGNEMSDVYVYDMKGTKEYNDIQSVATGDRAIHTLWEKINSQLTDKDKKQIMIFRRGSTFIVGVRPEGSANERLKRKLESIHSMSFQGDELYIGYHHSKIEATFSADKTGEFAAKELLNTILQNADQDWSQIIAQQYLLAKPEILDIETVPSNTRLTFEQTLGVYFNGSRALERMDRLIGTIALLPNQDQPPVVTLKNKLAAQLVRAVGREIDKVMGIDGPVDEDDKEDLIYSIGKIADKSHLLESGTQYLTDIAICERLQQAGLTP